MCRSLEINPLKRMVKLIIIVYYIPYLHYEAAAARFFEEYELTVRLPLIVS